MKKYVSLEAVHTHTHGYFKEGNNGITLIALVITIIVLLILAGVTIAMLMGENGIIKQAKKAKEETERTGAKEKLQIEASGSYDEGKYNVNKAIENLNNNLHITNEQITNSDGVLAVEYENHKFYIDKKGKVTEGLTAPIIASNPKEYFGKTVTNYKCENSEGVNEWKVFYADDENIYLITKDNISHEYAPNGKKGTQIVWNGGSIMLKTVYADYVGSQDIINNKQILKWIKYVGEQPNRGTYNIKSVAYLLDTQAWSIFSGEKAEYAIGGPTVEMFIKSYNRRHPENVIEYETDLIGYKIKWETDEDFSTSITGLDTEDNLQKRNMWIASPSAYNSIRVIYTNKTGDLTNCDYNQVFAGISPIVCLKSDVELKELEDGIF